MEIWEPEKGIVIEMNKGTPVKIITKPKGDSRTLAEVVSDNKSKPAPSKTDLAKDEIVDIVISEYADGNGINNTG